MKITLLLSCLLVCFYSSAQIDLQQDFEGDAGDWILNGFDTTSSQTCSGDSARDNIWSSNNSEELLSPNTIELSNGTDLTISFEYKIVDWSAATNPTPPGWGIFTVDYSTNNGSSWTNIETIDDSNHVTSNQCAGVNLIVSGNEIPSGSNFQLRLSATWNSGDYYLYFDSISAAQVSNTPPQCDAEMTTPANGSDGVDINQNISWSAATGIPTGYRISMGTSPGSTDIADDVDVGFSNTYNPGTLAYETTYYVTILPYNTIGDADGDTCTEYSFTTRVDPSIPITCGEDAQEIEFCYSNSSVEEYVFTSDNGNVLNVNVLAGTVENNADEFIVIDSDGTELYNGYGTVGIVAGLSFQSSGGQITVKVVSDGSDSCQTGDRIPIVLEVDCASCVTHEAEFIASASCSDGSNGFFATVNILDMGSATAIEISDNQNSESLIATETGSYLLGPYPNNTDVFITTTNVDDDDCEVISGLLTQEICNDLCNNALPFCSATGLIFESNSGNSSAEPGIDYECLGSQPDPTWFYLSIGQPGTLEMAILQYEQFDPNGQPAGDPLDVDYIIWGPFDSPDQCNNLNPSNSVSCSFAPDAVEFFTIPDAQVGEFYVILITNYSQDQGFINFQQIGGDGATDCAIVIADLGEDQTICEGEEVVLDASSSLGTEYQWFLLDEDTQEFEEIDGATDSTLTVTSSGTYQVEVSNDFGFSATDEVTVNVTPEAIIDFGSEQLFLCQEEEIPLDALPQNQEDYSEILYRWSLNGMQIQDELSNELVVTEEGIYEVEVTADDCITIQSIEIIGVDFTLNLGEDQVLCNEESFLIQPIIDGDEEDEISYLWSTGEQTETLEVTQSGLYSLEATINGCTVFDDIDINFVNVAAIDLGEDRLDCFDAPVILDATDPMGQSDQYTYQWFLVEDDLETVLAETSPVLTLTKRGLTANTYPPGTYKVVASSETCIIEDTVSINSYNVDDCIISQGISPGSSPGKNDELDLTFLADRTGIANLKIFNRYGTIVFEKDDYVNEFNGTDTNGNKLPTGTYYYVIKMSKEDDVFGTTKTGYIYVNQTE